MNKQQARKARQQKMRFRRDPEAKIQVLEADGKTVKEQSDPLTVALLQGVSEYIAKDLIAKTRAFETAIIHD